MEVENQESVIKQLKKKVSIIMPVKNASLHLEACIQSIRSQSYHNWELIAVDDHSEDNTSEILAKWAKLDIRIITTKNKDNGIIEALKTAFSLSTGEYIHRMDSDDLMPIHKLIYLIQGIEEPGIQLSTGKVKYFGTKLQEGYLKYEQWLNDIKQEHFWEDVFLECVLPSPCWMMERDLFYDYINDPQLHYPEDYYLSFYLASKNIQVRKIGHFLHLWRDHPSRASRNDINYKEQGFIAQKLHFFSAMALDKQRHLLLWGAGRKGKKLAKVLIQMKIAFRWLSNNPKKVNHNIYGLIIEESENIEFSPRLHQVIIGFSNPEEKKEAEELMQSLNMKKGNDFFSFY